MFQISPPAIVHSDRVHQLWTWKTSQTLVTRHQSVSSRRATETRLAWVVTSHCPNPEHPVCLKLMWYTVPSSRGYSCHFSGCYLQRIHWILTDKLLTLEDEKSSATSAESSAITTPGGQFSGSNAMVDEAARELERLRTLSYDVSDILNVNEVPVIQTPTVSY